MKCLFFIFMVLGLTFLFVGCAGFPKFYKKTYKTKDERLTLVEQKIQELEQELSNLNSSDQDLGKRIEELSQKTTTIDTNYSKLHETVNSINSRVERKECLLESNLSEAQKNIDDLENKLNKINEIEKVKTDLQNQIIVLLAQRTNIKGSELGEIREVVKEEANDIITQKQEIIKGSPEVKKEEEDNNDEESERNMEKEKLQNMMDDALALYREGNYKESLRKWKEVLSIDPGNLEAKFNMEIVKEKIKPLSKK